MASNSPFPIIEFLNAVEWEHWLKKNHAKEECVWVCLRKKAYAGPDSLTYRQALDSALSWGWIDGLRKRNDEETHLLKFTPRRPRSVWSQINCEHIARLDKDGRMQAPGWAAVEVSKKNGYWDRAYTGPKNSEVPPDLAEALAQNKMAGAFFKTLSSQNRYAVLFRIQIAIRPETRRSRIEKYVAMLARGETLH